MTRRQLLIAVALGAWLVWLTVSTVILTGDWYLSCTIDGQELGGMDCIDSTVIPETESAPLGLGFVPLAVIWVVATTTLGACGLLAWWQRRSRRSTTA